MKKEYRNKSAAICLSLLASLLGTGNVSFSRAEEGTRGGAEVIDRKGYKELRDLLDRTVCDWKSGDDLFAEIPSLVTTIQNLSKLDWYFAFNLEREIRSLGWCFTGSLVKVNTRDRDSIAVPVDYNTQQVAIRMLDGDEVYIDADLFQQLSPRAKGYLILHETIHSFLDLNESMRNSKLRSMVKAISKVDGADLSSRQQLQMQVRRNSIQIAMSTAQMDPYQDFILYVLGTPKTRAEILSRTANVEKLFAMAKDAARFISHLTKNDVEDILQFSKESAIQEICSTDSAAARVLSRRPDIQSETLIACLSAVKEDQELKRLILSNPSLNLSIDSLMRKMAEKWFSISEARLMVSTSITAMTATPSRENPILPFTSLSPVQNFDIGAVNAQGAGFYVYLRSLIQVGAWDLIQSKVSGNELFYTAFSFRELSTQLETITPPIPREKDLAKVMISEIPTDFWKAFFSQLEKDVGVESATRFKGMLDFGKLGIKGE